MCRSFSCGSAVNPPDVIPAGDPSRSAQKERETVHNQLSSKEDRERQHRELEAVLHLFGALSEVKVHQSLALQYTAYIDFTFMQLASYLHSATSL